MRTFDDKVVLVTGSSRGIGAGIAQAFARHGAKVVVHGRSMDALRATQDSVVALGGQAMVATADVTAYDQIEAMRGQIEERFGVVDVLVANAGGSFTPPGPLEDVTEAGWRASVDGNLTATFLTLKSFLPGMKRRGSGSIVTITSSAGRRPYPLAPLPYAVAKAGIILLTQGVAAQVGPHGIRANCIAPETILTERNQERIPEARQEALLALHPIKRLGTAEDVAEAALFLASDAASWITGAVLDISGGAVMIS